MIQGGKLVASDGKQVAVFPSQDLNITQGTNTSYSHKNTKNTDNAARSGRKKLYAPCDLIVYNNASSGGYGIVYFHTVEPVYTSRYGLTHFTMVLMHDNNAQRWTQGKIYRQGEHIYDEGDADPSGLTTGVHVHYEVATGHQTVRVRQDSNSNFEINNSVYLDDIFYINMTDVLSGNPPNNQFKGDHTYKWLIYDGGVTPDPKPDGILTLMLSKALPDFM